MRGSSGHCRGAAELWSPVCREDACAGSRLLLWESRTLSGGERPGPRTVVSCAASFNLHGKPGAHGPREVSIVPGAAQHQSVEQSGSKTPCLSWCCSSRLATGGGAVALWA